MRLPKLLTTSRDNSVRFCDIVDITKHYRIIKEESFIRGLGFRVLGLLHSIKTLAVGFHRFGPTSYPMGYQGETRY